MNAGTLPPFACIIYPAVLSEYAALYIASATFVHIYARQDAFAWGFTCLVMDSR